MKNTTDTRINAPWTKMATRRRTAIAATLGVVVGSGIWAGSAIGENDDPVPLAAERSGPAVMVEATVARTAALNDFAPFAVRVDEAREVPAPPTARLAASWYVVPADRGACASLGDGGLVCGTDDQLSAGRILAVDRPLPAMQSNGSLEAAPAAGPVRIAGLVADDIAEVIAYDDSGAEIGRARVNANVYEILPADHARAFGGITLLGRAGETKATVDVSNG